MGECKSWTVDRGLDCGLNHGPDYGLDYTHAIKSVNEEERVTSGVRVPGGNLSVCLNLE